MSRISDMLIEAEERGEGVSWDDIAAENYTEE